MDQRVKIFTLGGLDEDGKNCLIIEVDNDIYVIEAGVKYPDKTMPGIDYIIPDFTYLKKNKHRVKAYILLHGHVDEFGALPYIYNEVPAPVYGSEVTYQMGDDYSSSSVPLIISRRVVGSPSAPRWVTSL